MKKFPPLPIIDMLAQAKKAPLSCQGRHREIAHMARVIGRQQHNNLIIVGRRGVGKSTLIQGFATALLEEELTHMPALPVIQLDTRSVIHLIRHAPSQDAALEHIQAAFTSLPPSICVIDDADMLADEIQDAATFEYLFSAFIQFPARRLILIFEEEQFNKIQETYNRSFKTFDTLAVKELSKKTCVDIVLDRATSIGQKHAVRIKKEALTVITDESSRLIPHRSQPDASLRFLDEAASAAALTAQKLLTKELAEKIVADRLDIPSHAVSKNQKQHVATLLKRLESQVIGQPAATRLVSSVMERSLLGLKNPNRPLGSFLFLGPSGVGKTELAKVLAKEVYGSDRAFTRIDMSEFSDAHTAARLTGAPPGYVGYEAGGQLTNPVMQNPFSLILLDEIEKAHPSIFDLFLQVFDDGRLTDGQGRTVDFTNTTIIATSNIGIQDIVAGAQQGHDVISHQFMQQTMMPHLQQRFRLEFLNRFEAMVVFRPFTSEDLVAIARLEIQKLEKRLAHHNLKITVSDAELKDLIQDIANPALGARPLRRALEEQVEAKIATALLQTTSL